MREMLQTVRCCSGRLELAGEKQTQIFEFDMGGMLGSQFGFGFWCVQDEQI